jgi:hypothetical protein
MVRHILRTNQQMYVPLYTFFAYDHCPYIQDNDDPFEQDFRHQENEGHSGFDHPPDSGSERHHGSQGRDNNTHGAQQDDPDARGPRQPCLGENDPDLALEGLDISGMASGTNIDDLKLTMSFIRALRQATLDDPGMKLDAKALERLRNPPREPLDVNNSEFLFSLKNFLHLTNSAEKTYDNIRATYLEHHPDKNMLSYYQVEQRIKTITGIESIIHDMCPNSCLAYTGPFAHIEDCPMCGTPRYDQIRLAATGGKEKVSVQKFHTIPLGPQLQALWRDPESANRVQYCERCTREILEELERNHGHIESYDDFFHGSDYLEAVRDGRIDSNSMVLMLSFDGAQLYQSKASDCWIYIWVLFDLPPDLRYKKRYVLIGGFIPGPNKLKNADSFFFPGLHHLAALQREGLRVWDSSRNTSFKSCLFLALGTADGPGMVHLNGLVGYHGKFGCRQYCSLQGRHKPGGSHYYPVLLKPNNYIMRGCDHHDININDLPTPSPDIYNVNLKFVMDSPSDTQYKKRRLETGISKPSILIGMHSTFTIPFCFGSDIMHLCSINIPDLLLSLWRGLLDCEKTDDLRTWDWAVLTGERWKSHGRAVANCSQYLPGSFDCPPRNPAEKISSGYKAWEFLIYLYGLCPALLYHLLPEKYWRNFCKLVAAVRILNQYNIPATKLQRAHQLLLEFELEFELLYYQHRVDRMHFVRPSMHSILHLAGHVTRYGPPICSSQWTMERTIGNLGQEIRQPSNPYANLSQRGIQRAQLNALKAMVPRLDSILKPLPQGSKDLGGGFVLLRALERKRYTPRMCEKEAINNYLGHLGVCQPIDFIYRWARLRPTLGLAIASTSTHPSQLDLLAAIASAPLTQAQDSTGAIIFHYRLSYSITILAAIATAPLTQAQGSTAILTGAFIFHRHLFYSITILAAIATAPLTQAQDSTGAIIFHYRLSYSIAILADSGCVPKATSAVVPKPAKGKKLRIGPANTARNHCGRNWLLTNTTRLADDFNKYFALLTPEQKKVSNLQC